MRVYQAPPPNTHVLCLDGLGPVSAKTYPAARWSERLPRLTPDYGRRGKRWVFGTFEPQTGLALTDCAAKRDDSHFLAFLNRVVQVWPEGAIILILDKLSIHKPLDVRLGALAHERVRFLFQPIYAPWLNLIELWWKTLRSLALKGRRFQLESEIDSAIYAGTDYWNQARQPYTWRKAA